MRVLTLILPLLLIGPLSYGQLGKLSKGADAIAEKRVKNVEKSLTFKSATFGSRSVDCQRTTEDQRKKLSKKKSVREAIASLESILEANYQKMQVNEQISARPGNKENNILKTISANAEFMSLDKYKQELDFYKGYFDTKRKEASAETERLAEEKKEQQAEEKRKQYEARMAQSEKEAREKEIAKEEERRALDAERAAEKARIAEERRIAIEKERAAYEAKRKAQLDSITEVRRVEKENIARRNEAKRQADSAAWANLTPGERVLEKIKPLYAQAKKAGYYKEDVFNKIYQSLGDAQSMGVAEDKILIYMEGLKKAAVNNRRKLVAVEDLKYMSTAGQEETKTKILSLEASIKNQTASKSNVDAIRKQYESLLNYSRFYMEKFYFKSDYKYKAESGLIRLELDHGDVDTACEMLYKTDRNNFDRSYRGGKCSAWIDVKEAPLRAEAARKRQVEVAKWRKDNPGMIKMKSLLRQYSSDVEDYLGKPTKKRNDIVTYSTSDGTYEIGYTNGRVVLIEFTPGKTIKFDKELLSSGGGLFDHKDNMPGLCTGKEEEDSVGGLKTLMFGWDCDSGTTSITFFGDDGKLVSVTAM